MRLSRKSDYALRAIKHMASLPKGKLGSINSISKAEAIPREFLAKILKDLTRGGVLKSFQGVTGGYCLAKPAKNINYLTIVEIIDGPLQLSIWNKGNKGSNNAMMKAFLQKQEKQIKTAFSKEHFGKYSKAKK
jgi:Rrf2 family protein